MTPSILLIAPSMPGPWRSRGTGLRVEGHNDAPGKNDRAAYSGGGEPSPLPPSPVISAGYISPAGRLQGLPRSPVYLVYSVAAGCRVILLTPLRGAGVRYQRPYIIETMHSYTLPM